MAGPRVRLVFLAGLLGALGGCAAPAGPEVLTIEASRYDAAFDAALEAARTLDLPPARRDRRAGTIETEPHIAPSVFEPWRRDGAAFGQRVAQTLACDRRWARFEFTPAGAPPEAPAPEPPESAEPLRGPDLLGLDAPPDRTATTGDLELRVQVYVERSHEPGLRRSTWTRSATTYSETIRPGTDELLLPRTFWTPLRRDRRYERLLLARVEKMLAAADPASRGEPGPEPEGGG